MLHVCQSYAVMGWLDSNFQLRSSGARPTRKCPLEPHPTPDQVRAHGASVLPHSQSDERETLTLTQNVTINLEVAERETSPRVIRILI
jgi:hypothetical protein